MNKKLAIIAYTLFVVAFFAPEWSVMASMPFMANVTSEAQQYGGLQSLLMGVYNLALIIPSLVCLILGRKKQTFYSVSIVLSAASVLFMCWWAFGAFS